MKDDTNSYFLPTEPHISSSSDVELSLEQWTQLRQDTTEKTVNSIHPTPEPEELLDWRSQLSPFYQGLYWGVIFMSTVVFSAISGASLTRIKPVHNTITSLIQEKNPQDLLLVSQSTQSPAASSLTRPVNLLIMGINSLESSEKRTKNTFVDDSQTILLLKFQPQENVVSITFIPQDSQVEIPGLGFGTIKEANNYGGINMVSQAISETLVDVEIDRYITATPETLFEFINLLGGVEVFVPDSSDSKSFQPNNLVTGWQTLNSKQVKEFVHHSGSSDDNIHTIQQHQILIEAIRKRLHNPTFIANLPKTVQTLQQYLDTDLTLAEMKALINFLHQRERDEVTINLFPGYNYKSRLAQDSFIVSNLPENPPTRKNSSAYSSHSWQNIPIALQNTTQNPQLSLRVLEYLISKGFDNVYLSKHLPLKLDQTKIMLQSKDLTTANYLQQILGIGKLEFYSTRSIDPELTILIGEDAKFIFLEDDFLRGCLKSNKSC